MRITVGIPATRAETLPAAIDSVICQTHTDWELIIVAQGTGTTVPEAARRAAAASERIRLVSIPQPGTSRARNAALEHTDSEVIAMMDDDCEAGPGWLSTIASCFEEDPQLALVGGALVGPASVGFLARCPSLLPSDAVYDPSRDAVPPPGWDWVGANFAIRRWAAESVGPFDEHLGPGTSFMAGEDTDYKLRMERCRVKMRSTPRAVVHHTSGTRRGLRAVMRFQRGYAVGNGALAGKLTLLGDSRGREWLLRTRQQTVQTWWHQQRLAPSRLAYWSYYRSAYNRCLRHYEIDERGALRPRNTPMIKRLQ